MPGVIIFDPNDSDVGFSVGDDSANALYLDKETGALFIADLNTIFEWDADPATNQTYTWESGYIRTPSKINMGAVIIEADTYNDLQFTMRAEIKGVMTQITVLTVMDDEPIRLPGGYLSNLFQIEVNGTDRVTSISVAESIFDLRAR